MSKKENNEHWLGKTVRIIYLDDPYSTYAGRTGVVTYVDDMGQLHGTWGSLAIIPEVDKFEEIEKQV